MGSEEIVVAVDADVADLVPTFLANCRKQAQALRAAVAAADFGAAQQFGHTLAGSGTSYGFDRISQLGREIERAALAADLSDLAGLAQQLEDYLARVRAVTG